MNTFSKSLTPTIRISYMILPTHLANRFYEQLSFYSCTVSNFEQYTLAAFLDKGYFEKHINRMRLYYIRQRKRLIQEIEGSKLKDCCEIIENEAGLHFLVKLKTQKPDCEIIDNLQKKGIRIQALSEYFFTNDVEKEHYFIVNYSNIELDKISQACDALYEVIR